MKTRTTTSLPDVTQLTVGNGNWSDSSQRGPIHSIVLHTIVGTIQGANAEFNIPHNSPPPYGKSAHYGIGLDGKYYQWCDEDNVAYHAGNWIVNTTSIGIEHEDGGNANGVRPDILYEKSAQLVAEICKFYDFPADHDHIFRHHDVIDKTFFPGGTACPDALDTDRIIRRANEILNPPPPPPVPEPAPMQQPVVSPTTPLPPVQPIQEPPVAPVVDQTVPVPTATPIEQAPVASSVPDTSSSNQAGRVPIIAEQPIMQQTQSKPTSFQWIIELLVNLLALVGILLKPKKGAN